MAWGTVSSEDASIDIGFTDFDGRQTSSTIFGPGLLTFTSPPKVTITTPPTQGTAVVEAGGDIIYTPNVGTEVNESFQYTVMTQLGDTDTATVDIGSMDLDILNFDSSFLNEVSEDNPGSFVRWNIDDDDYNQSVDLTDSGFVDDDLVQLTIIPRPPDSVSNQAGYFTITYDETIVTVWHQDDKLQPSGFTSPKVHSDTKIDALASVLDFQLYVEGRAVGKTTIWLTWHNTDLNVHGVFDSVVVNVMDLDLDIDSDNNNGFDLPDSSPREEFLESNLYGLGKLVMQNYSVANAAESYTPIRVSLPTGLSLSDPNLRVRLNFEQFSEAGTILLWLRNKNDPLRNGDDASLGGDLLQSDILYTLGNLRYAPASGEIILYVAGLMENPNIKKLAGVEDNGKPQKAVKATLVVAGVDMINDRAKYIVTQTDSFFYRFQFSETVRNAIASSRVYGGPGALPSMSPADSISFSQELLDGQQLLVLGLTDLDVVNALTSVNSLSGLKAGLYRDYVSDKYIIAYAGTEGELADVIEDLLVGTTGYVAQQFESAIRIGSHLADVSVEARSHIYRDRTFTWGRFGLGHFINKCGDNLCGHF